MNIHGCIPIIFKYRIELIRCAFCELETFWKAEPKTPGAELELFVTFCPILSPEPEISAVSAVSFVSSQVPSQA